MLLIRCISIGRINDEKEDILASYLIDLGEEVLKLLIAKGAKKEDSEDIIQNTFYKVYTLLGDLRENTIRPWFLESHLMNT